MVKETESIEDRLLRVDWPHTRSGYSWKRGSPAFKRLCHYAKQLAKLGMSHDQAASMFSDLYWDAADEINKAPKVEEQPTGWKRTKPHYDEFQISFLASITELSAEELGNSYEFCNNLIVRNGMICWTISGGGTANGELPDFFDVLRIDRSYAFGPTKIQKGWPLEKLAKLNAVGVYKPKKRAKKMRK